MVEEEVGLKNSNNTFFRVYRNYVHCYTLFLLFFSTKHLQIISRERERVCVCVCALF